MGGHLLMASLAIPTPEGGAEVALNSKEQEWSVDSIWLEGAHMLPKFRDVGALGQGHDQLAPALAWWSDRFASGGSVVVEDGDGQSSIIGQ